MKSELISCYVCGKQIPPFTDNLKTTQKADDGRRFQIFTVTVECPNGHKQKVGVSDE